MVKDTISIHRTFEKDALTLYNAWLNSIEHENMTGGEADIHAEVGSEYKAWDGYIMGKILELEKGKRILCTWRTTEFPETEENSLLEVKFTNVTNGAKVTLNHTNIPKGDKEKYLDGWIQFYFEPMGEYFGEL